MILPQLGAAHRLLRIDTVSIESNITSGVYDLTAMVAWQPLFAGFSRARLPLFQPQRH
jgi:hypothetical protein